MKLTKEKENKRGNKYLQMEVHLSFHSASLLLEDIKFLIKKVKTEENFILRKLK
jgi:hypothetical protein